MADFPHNLRAGIVGVGDERLSTDNNGTADIRQPFQSGYRLSASQIAKAILWQIV
jgi:hypothetical protein